MSKSPIILSLCDLTGNAVRPWADVGYECWTVDVQHERGIGKLNKNVRKVGADILRFCPPLNRPIAFVFAFPPCTHFAVSGARWFKGKGLDALADAILLVSACAKVCEASDAPYILENPIGTLSTYWREPDYKFDPCDYAGYLDNPSWETYTKKTCLWTGGRFKMPVPKRVKPTNDVWGESRLSLAGWKDDGANIRSETPKGFAKAVFQANFPIVSQTYPIGLTHDI